MIHEKEAFLEGVREQLDTVDLPDDVRQGLEQLTVKETKQASRLVSRGIPDELPDEKRASVEHGSALETYVLQQADLEKEAVIKQEGDEWVLYDSEGEEVLGRHDTKEEAKEQEQAIQANKHAYLKKEAQDQGGSGTDPGFSIGDIDWDNVGRGAAMGAPLGAGGGLLYSLLTGGNPLLSTLGGAGLGGLAGGGAGGAGLDMSMLEQLFGLGGGEEEGDEPASAAEAAGLTGEGDQELISQGANPSRGINDQSYPYTSGNKRVVGGPWMRGDDDRSVKQKVRDRVFRSIQQQAGQAPRG